jgi:co-chaperonin GroES (HSP10)
MPVISAPKTQQLALATNPKEALLEAVGDLSEIDVFHNQILVGIYIRPEVTKGGIIRPGQNIDEDEYQGKVGLVLKTGPTAFLSNETTDFMGQTVNVGDWIVYRVGDGWQVMVNGTACRMLTDRTLKMRAKNPEIFL